MQSEAINIDEYLGCGKDDKFDFLYLNYPIIKAMLRNYREEIITDVVEMKNYNRRKANGELGVRIMVSNMPKRPTENQAVSNLTVAEAIDEGYLDDDFFKDTDNKQDLIRRVSLYHMLSADYELFRMKLDTLNPEDQKIIKPYLMKQKTVFEMANEMGIAYRSTITKIYRIKKRLSDQVKPRLRRGA